MKKLYYSPSGYAKHIGVKIGVNNFLASKGGWGTEPYLISIGNNCQITTGVKFFTHGGGHPLRKDFASFDTFGKITIGNWVYIGNNALIMPGVTICDESIIAAGSVVTKSVPSRVVVAGNPATIICTLDEYRSKNSKYNFETKGLSSKEKESILTTSTNERFISKPFLSTQTILKS